MSQSGSQMAHSDYVLTIELLIKLQPQDLFFLLLNRVTYPLLFKHGCDPEITDIDLYILRHNTDTYWLLDS